MKRLVFTVTYNERENVGPLIAAIRGGGHDALVVDDRGHDDTAGAVRQITAGDERVFLIARDSKQGYASASRAGFAWGLAQGYDQIAQLDADGSHDPQLLPVMFRALDEVDLAIGSRYVFGGRMPGLPPFRRLISRLAGDYLRWMLDLPIADPTSGYRAWRADFLARVLPAAPDAQGFAFLYEMACRASQAGVRFREIPITFHNRRAGESKMSMDIVRDAMRVARKLRREARFRP
jgi:glycosyltransferase involved in cell wall biosynthesis